MAVNIDTVYQQVLAISNKEQRGYITPQEFNLMANKAQLEIFEGYFHDLKTAYHKRKNDMVYADETEMTMDKLQFFDDVVKDGQAKVWVTGLNVLLMLGVYFGGILDFNVMAVDPAAGTLAELAGVAFALVAQLGGSSLTHVVLRGAPVVGASHSQ